MVSFCYLKCAASHALYCSRCRDLLHLQGPGSYSSRTSKAMHLGAFSRVLPSWFNASKLPHPPLAIAIVNMEGRRTGAVPEATEACLSPLSPLFTSFTFWHLVYPSSITKVPRKEGASPLCPSLYMALADTPPLAILYVNSLACNSHLHIQPTKQSDVFYRVSLGEYSMLFGMNEHIIVLHIALVRLTSQMRQLHLPLSPHSSQLHVLPATVSSSTDSPFSSPVFKHIRPSRPYSFPEKSPLQIYDKLWYILPFLMTSLHVVVSPYTKVEETPALHAVHDILAHGIGLDALQQVNTPSTSTVSTDDHKLV